MKRRTKAQISFNMSRIRSKGTRIEKMFSCALRKAKIKFKKHMPVFGSPDFVIAGRTIAVFCDSSFWHGYRKMSTSRHNFKSNRIFWKNKICKNIERDKQVNKVLKKNGWKVIRFWDFQIIKDDDKCINKVRKILALEK
jgi:DNA mismatch endonuclease Vsr